MMGWWIGGLVDGDWSKGDHVIRVELPNVKGLVAALVDGAADLAEVLAAGGEYHA